MDIKNVPYEELSKFFINNFPIGFFCDGDINDRFALVSLISNITNQLKAKDPKINSFIVIRKLISDQNVSDDVLKGLACICDGFAYYCKEIPDLGLKGKQKLIMAKKLLDSYLPF